MVYQGASGSGSHVRSQTSCQLGLKLSEGLPGARLAVSRVARPRRCAVGGRPTRASPRLLRCPGEVAAGVSR